MQVCLDRNNVLWLELTERKGELVRDEISKVGKGAQQTIQVLVNHYKYMASPLNETEVIVEF